MNLEDAARLSHADWTARAEALRRGAETRLLIGDRFVEAAAGDSFDTISPVDGRLIARCAAAGAEDVDRAVRIARASFASGAWSRRSPRARMKVMFRWAELIEANAAELALMDSLDMGKPIRDMIHVDMPQVIDCVRFFAESIDKVTGSTTATEHDVLSTTIREPIGVVGCISPWNYPLLMAIWKIAPSLAAGNSTILKPAEQSPLSCLRVAELFLEAGGPPGALQVLNGPGEVTGQAMGRHMDIDKVSFTGSTEVGKLLLTYAGQSNMKRVALECGGKGPHIFCDDLEGELFDRAVRTAIDGIFFNQGEVCSAGSRLIVHEAIHDRFVARFAELGRDAYRCGDPLDPATNLGPLVDHAAQARVLSMVSRATAEGARLAFGGHAAGGALAAGAFVVPTLLSGVGEGDFIARNEVFGPVAATIRVRDDDEAIAVANNSDYGLQGGVWTDNFRRAHRYARDVHCGTIFVNSFEEGDMTQPFGGYKQSGNARDKCFDSLLAYMNQKAVWYRLN